MYFNLVECEKRIAEIRSLNKYTQELFADILGIDRSFLSRVEAGRKGFSIDLYIRVSEIFNISLDYLITGKMTKADTNLLKENMDDLICRLQSFRDSL